MDYRLGSMVAEVHGEGPDIVMIHGLGGSSNSFTPLLDCLQGYRVIRPDLPGAGRSAWQPTRNSIASLAASICDISRGLGTSQVCIVGHSMGTLIGMTIAAHGLLPVSRLILFGALSELPARARDNLRTRAEQARRNGMSAIADAVAQGSLARRTGDHYTIAKAWVRESVLHQPCTGYAAHCLALAEHPALPYTAIRCPVTLIHGDNDTVAPPAGAEELTKRLANSSIVRLASCGHWPMIEAPGQSATALQQALSAGEQHYGR